MSENCVRNILRDLISELREQASWNEGSATSKAITIACRKAEIRIDHFDGVYHHSDGEWKEPKCMSCGELWPCSSQPRKKVTS